MYPSVWSPQGTSPQSNLLSGAAAVGPVSGSLGLGSGGQQSTLSGVRLNNTTEGDTLSLYGPQSPAQSSITGGGGGGAGTGGGGATSGDIASAQNAQQVASLKNEIMSRRQRANSIFEALTGAVQALAQDKRGALEGQFAQEQGRATEDFTKEGDNLNWSYASRGLGDSSFRINAQEDASKMYSRAIQDLGTQRNTGLAKVGQEVAGRSARYSADRDSINSLNLDEIGRRDDGTIDSNALVDARNQLDNRIRELGVEQAEMGTEAGFRGKLDQVAPYTGVATQLKSALTSLVQSAAPKVVKDRLASAIISNYAPTDQATWEKFYQEAGSQVASPTSVA